MKSAAHFLLLFAVCWNFSCRTPSPLLPDVLLINPSVLAQARQSYHSATPPSSGAISALMADAKQALAAEPVSVIMKRQPPPSGNSHDYMSLAPYWWPDSTQPGGLPYIRRDGEVNPEYTSFGDNERLQTMVDNVQTLALAYWVSGEERYAQKAIAQIRVWFVDTTTQMTPHLNYAQAIKGVNDGRGIGIIETYAFRRLVDAMSLLRQSPQWTPEMQSAMVTWFSSYLTWLLESPNGKDEAGWKNNHGSAYDVQASCIAIFVGRTDVARRILSEVGTKRIAVQIEPDGAQPLELERTKSWGYANMNLDALIELGVLGERFGIDVWNYSTDDGRSIRRAIDFLLPFALGEKMWMWRQITPLHSERFYYAACMGAERFADERYAHAARMVALREVQSSRVMFYAPPLE